ncbi:MAG: hypothetical protein JO142_10210 [Burkholderiales bacterium]|nr:hypothetical protein [Burkholderiales bacterium]
MRLIFMGKSTMTLFTEQKLTAVDVSQTEVEVLDETMWDEVSGGDPCPQVDNNPH